ncbi:hypothetical protein [Ornithinibacillus sp. FSL M8-0202]
MAGIQEDLVLILLVLFSATFSLYEDFVKSYYKEIMIKRVSS